MPFDPEIQPHRRKNPLTGEWVLVSPHRASRPWQGQQETPNPISLPQFDPGCYLCPTNLRSSGIANPAYDSTFVFENDFPAILPDLQDSSASHEGLLQSAPVVGISRVICFSPRHDLTLAEMETSAIERVVDVWAAQVEELGRRYEWVQIFENKGAAMGCSNPHPHGQVWAGDWLPSIVQREDLSQRQYWEQNDSNLLLDYALLERERGERVVEANSDWILVVPFWAVWPFEMLLLPLRPVARITELAPAQRASLAEILRMGVVRYDNLFETSFPYSMGWHGAPSSREDAVHWQLHAHFFPPLLRSSTVRKFMVGYEMLAEPQRDLTPEQAARRLRGVGSIHYRG